MSGAGDDAVEQQKSAPATVAVEMSVMDALKTVLQAALLTDELARGLHESAKALDKRTACFAVLAENCDEPMYVKLVEALCNEHSIPLLKVSDNKQLGQWCGLCKYDKEGEARKVVKCSCCVVKDWGLKAFPENTGQAAKRTKVMEAKAALEKHFGNMKKM